MAAGLLSSKVLWKNCFWLDTLSPHEHVKDVLTEINGEKQKWYMMCFYIIFIAKLEETDVLCGNFRRFWLRKQPRLDSSFTNAWSGHGHVNGIEMWQCYAIENFQISSNMI